MFLVGFHLTAVSTTAKIKIILWFAFHCMPFIEFLLLILLVLLLLLLTREVLLKVQMIESILSQQLVKCIRIKVRDYWKECQVGNSNSGYASSKQWTHLIILNILKSKFMVQQFIKTSDHSNTQVKLARCRFTNSRAKIMTFAMLSGSSK